LIKSSTIGVFTAEATTQTEPVDINESIGGGQSELSPVQQQQLILI